MHSLTERIEAMRSRATVLEARAETAFAAHAPAQTLRELRAALRSHADRIVCVLLDLTMPYMDGAQAFREIRSITRAVPILLMSGYSREDVRDQFIDVELADFLQKPFDPRTLHERLWRLLDAAG